MKRKEKTTTASIEKHMLTGMITSTEFLKKIKDIYDPDLIELPYVHLVGNWCLEHYAKYKEAPNRLIKQIFDDKMTLDKRMKPEMVALVSDFLKGLSKEYSSARTFNVQYAYDQALKKFQGTTIQNIAEDLQELYEQGKWDEAEELIREFKVIRKTDTKCIQPLLDMNALETAFEDTEKQRLFSVRGELGKLFNPFFVRESLVGFQAPAKSGKSWWLLYFVFHALMSRCNVVLFQCGDMSQDQFLRRMFTLLCGKSHSEELCGLQKEPILDCKSNQDNSCNKIDRPCQSAILDDDGELLDPADYPEDYEPCTACRGKKDFKPATMFREIDLGEPIDIQEVKKKAGKAYKRTIGRRFFLFTYGTGQLTIKTAEEELDNLFEDYGFVPDVVCFDYADIMGVENPKSNPRDYHNERWIAARRLSLERHCLVLFPTQSAATSYDEDDQTLNDFSNDRRKVDHVTGHFALNTTLKEKTQNQMRWALLAGRDSNWNPEAQIGVLQDITQGKVHVDSWRVYRTPQRRDK